MILRSQDILYIIIIFINLRNSSCYLNPGEIGTQILNVPSQDAGVQVKLHDTVGNAISRYSTEHQQKSFRLHNMPLGYPSPYELEGDGSGANSNINVTSNVNRNETLGYMVVDNDGSTVDDIRSEDAEKSSETIYTNDEVQQNECNVKENTTVNCTTSNQTCFDDNLPCNVTQDDYMQVLYDYMYPKTAEWVLIFVHGVVFVTGLVGNALVCIAVYTNYSMRTVTNVFIVNLAVADFLVILVCLPPSVIWDVTETWFLGQSMCKIILYFQTVSVTVSVLTLTFISVDRWYAICFPLRYRTKISRAVISVSIIWIVALLSDVPEFLALHLKKPKLRFESVLFTQCATSWDLQTEMNFYLTQLVLLYVLPLLLMMVAYFNIIRILWKSDTIPGHRESRTHHQYSCGYLRGSSAVANSSTMGQLRARRKAAKMLVAVVVMFATCYFPVHVFNLLRYTGNLEGGEITTIFSLCSHWLCYANSAVNPVIYNFMSGKFRREFRHALEKCRCGRKPVDERSFNQSHPTSRLHNFSPSTRSNYNLTSVRDITITRDLSRQTMQTTFTENFGNGHSTISPMLNQNKDT